MISRTRLTAWACRTAISVAAIVTVMAGHPGRGTAFGQSIGIATMAGFGSNGWLAPGSIAYLGTANNERGLAYNPVTNNLVLVSRANVSGTANNIVILNGTTGSLLKTMNPTGISGGTFSINMAGVGADEIGRAHV